MKITIVTVCLNSEKTLPFTLNSVLSQNYSDIEHVFVDGGSNDKTIELIENYPLTNKKIIKANGSRIYEALNIGIKNSSGDIISILHSNDILNSYSTITSVVNKFFQSKADILLSNIVFFNNEEFSNISRNYTSNKFKQWMLKFGLMPPHTGTFIKKKIYEEVGFYNEKYDIAGDFDFFIRCFSIKKKKYHHLNKTTVRMKTGGISGKNFYSYVKSTSEIYDSLKNNNIHSNIIYLILRFPAKIKQFIFLDKNKNYKEFKLKVNNFYYNKFKFDFKILKNMDDLKLNNNIILSAMNLAFLGSYSNSEIKKNKNMVNWPDGIFVKSVNTQLNKIPGREVINSIKIKKEDNINRILVLGMLSKKSKTYLTQKYNLPIINVELPYGNISEIINEFKLKINKDDLIFITLPTPKQEQFADYLSKKFNYFKIICIGGSISIVSGEEKQVPNWLINFEFLWRLRYETRRRLIRLIKSFFYYIYGKFITRKINNLKLYVIE